MYIPIYIFLYCDSTEPVLGVDLLLYAQDTQYLAHVSHNKFCDKSTPTVRNLILSQKKKRITKTHLL